LDDPVVTVGQTWDVNVPNLGNDVVNDAKVASFKIGAADEPHTNVCVEEMPPTNVVSSGVHIGDSSAHGGEKMALVEVDRGVDTPVDEVDKASSSAPPEEDPTRDVHFANHPLDEVMYGDG